MAQLVFFLITNLTQGGAVQGPLSPHRVCVNVYSQSLERLIAVWKQPKNKV